MKPVKFKSDHKGNRQFLWRSFVHKSMNFTAVCLFMAGLLMNIKYSSKTGLGHRKKMCIF